MSEISKYPKGVIIIHWLTLILLIAVFYIGSTFENYEFNEANMNRYRAHALLGMLILVLTVVRFVIKKKNMQNLPPEITYFSVGHKILVKAVCKLIYILLILTPLVGFIMIYQTGALSYDLGGAFPENPHFNETLESLHKIFIFSLLGVVAIHIVGVVVYRIKKGENLIKRICIFAK